MLCVFLLLSPVFFAQSIPQKSRHTNVQYAKVCMCYQKSVVFSLQQVLSASPHPHLFNDLFVQTGSLVLQFASSCLGERVTTLRQGDTKTMSADDNFFRYCESKCTVSRLRKKKKTCCKNIGSFLFQFMGFTLQCLGSKY